MFQYPESVQIYDHRINQLNQDTYEHERGDAFSNYSKSAGPRSKNVPNSRCMYVCMSVYICVCVCI